jgi:hypothetical protein
MGLSIAGSVYMYKLTPRTISRSCKNKFLLPYIAMHCLKIQLARIFCVDDGKISGSVAVKLAQLHC